MNTQTTNFKRRSIALVAVAALGLAACGSDDDASSDDTTVQDSTVQDSTEEAASADITIADPWSRQPAEGQTTSAVYGEVTNGTDETITAISATASVTDTVELHEVLMNDEGQMSMQEKEGGFEIAAGETFVFEPGGPHIMLLDIDAATYPDTVDVTLSFDNGTTLAFTADVRPIGDAMEEMGGMDEMDEMDDGSMDDSEMDDGSMDDSEMDDGSMDDSEMDDSGS